MNEIYLPSLRGVMGDWVYYSCLVPLSEIANRVSYANELHKSKKLSKLIQRKLKENRGKEICEYLENEGERFLNSLVIAVYGGEPKWFPAEIKPNLTDINEESISEDALNTIGFLRLSGKESLFALDGQHRLAGIKEVIRKDKEALADEEVNIIMVAHKNDATGLERTRRLFTTLNKKAVPVRKGEIIALDENDVMAIICRFLLERSKIFNDTRIAIKTTNNISPKDDSALTTLGNLYDLLGILFAKIYSKKNIGELKNSRRLPDQELKFYFDYAVDFFTKLMGTFPHLKEFFNSKNEKKVVTKYRHEKGGSMLFRPVGLQILFEILAELVKNGNSLDESILKVKDIPLELSKFPYVDVLWLKEREIMNPKGKVVVRDKLLLDLGVASALKRKENIQKKYEQFKSG